MFGFARLSPAGEAHMMADPPEEPERRFRSLMTFGTGEGRPPKATTRGFRTHAIAIVGEIALKVQHEFKMFDHDLSDGSDHIVIVDGLIVQVAAETCASERLVTGETAILTAFHHARALYEAHALSWWMCQDFAARWKRVLKDRLRDRLRFDEAMSKSIGQVQTDVAQGGHDLLADTSIGHLPTMFDMTRGSAVLEFDHALLWEPRRSMPKASGS